MMIEENEKLAGDKSSHINLKVKGNDGNEMLFRIRPSTRLNKLMIAYCNRQSFDVNSVKFMFNGYHVQADQTPLELHMEDGAEIDAVIDVSHDLNHKTVLSFQSGSHNKFSPYVGLQSGPGIPNVVGNSKHFVLVSLHNSGVNDKQSECCATHLIDEYGTFNGVGLDNFINKVKLGERGTSYAVAAIMGPQCSGKSTLLNHLFHTNFKEMNACNGRSPTTKGLWIAKGAGTEPCTIVMDLQGSDESELGEDDSAFEKQRASFVLAISDIVIINMWCRDIGLEQAASKRLLKTIFRVMWQSSIRSKTSLMFVIRDQTSTPLENLEPLLREDIQKIWDSIPKPEAHKDTSLSENINVQVVALSSYEDGAEQFKKQVASLREKLFQSIITPGGLDGDRQGGGAVRASGFSFSAQQIWKCIKENKDIDLPAHKVLMVNPLREVFANGNYSYSVANKKKRRKRRRDTPGSSDEVLDLPQHPDLHFPQTTVAYKRIRLHAPRQILRPLTIDWDMLTRFGETRRVEAIFGGDTPWRRFFDVGYNPAYRVLTLEFLCTFFFTPPAPNVLATEQCITFTIHGKHYKCTLGEFGVLLGFYTAEEVASPLFLDAPHETDQDILQRWWPRLTGGIPWGSGRDRTTRATSIVDPLHRYLHRCISSTITGRDHSREQVSQVDLFYLRSLLGPSGANLAWGMAAHFTSLHKAKASSKILCGAYITQIAKSLGVLMHEYTEMELGVYGCDRLDRSSVVSMGMAYKIESLGEREYRWSFDKGKTVWDVESARAHVGADPLPIPEAEGSKEGGAGGGGQDGARAHVGAYQLPIPEAEGGKEGGAASGGDGGGGQESGGGDGSQEGGSGGGGFEDVGDLQQQQRSPVVGVMARMGPDDVQHTLSVLDGRVRRTEELAQQSLQTGHLGLETGQRAEDMARQSLVLVERSYSMLHWLMMFAREAASRGGFLSELPPIPDIADDGEPRPPTPSPPPPPV